MNRFKDKVVLVTGGNRNTGLWIVKKFVDEGAKVFMCGSSEASTAKGIESLRVWFGTDSVVSSSVAANDAGTTLKDAKVIAQACDVGNKAQVEVLMDLIEKEAGRLDILVNNAADQGLGLGPILEMDPDAILKVMGTNVRGGFQVTQTAAKRFFVKQGCGGQQAYDSKSEPCRGTVVFLSSNTAQRAIRGRVAYCASKGAINSMVRALALDLAPFGIRVNCCAPGYIYTERWDVLDPQIAARRRANCPLGREAKGADIANVVAFLASEESGNMTGEIVTCDAGCSAQHMPADVDF